MVDIRKYTEKLGESLPSFTQSAISLLVSYVLTVNIFIYDNFLNRFTPVIWEAMARFEFGKLIPVEVAEKYGNAPLAIFWLISAILIFFLYTVTSSVWDTIKTLVPLEISEILGKNDQNEHYLLQRLLLRTGLATLYIIPYILAITFIRPTSIYVMNYSAGFVHISDPFIKQLLLIFPAALVWSIYFWLLLIIHNLFVFEEREVEIEREHDATLDVSNLEEE